MLIFLGSKNYNANIQRNGLPGRGLFLVDNLVKYFKSPENISTSLVIILLGINLRRNSTSEEYLGYSDKHIYCKIYFKKLNYEFDHWKLLHNFQHHFLNYILLWNGTITQKTTTININKRNQHQPVYLTGYKKSIFTCRLQLFSKPLKRIY